MRGHWRRFDWGCVACFSRSSRLTAALRKMTLGWRLRSGFRRRARRFLVRPRERVDQGRDGSRSKRGSVVVDEQVGTALESAGSDVVRPGESGVNPATAYSSARMSPEKTPPSCSTLAERPRTHRRRRRLQPNWPSTPTGRSFRSIRSNGSNASWTGTRPTSRSYGEPRRIGHGSKHGTRPPPRPRQILEGIAARNS